jgi:hypothetical protein
MATKAGRNEMERWLHGLMTPATRPYLPPFVLASTFAASVHTFATFAFFARSPAICAINGAGGFPSMCAALNATSSFIWVRPCR